MQNKIVAIICIAITAISNHACKKSLEEDKLFAEETQIEKFLTSTLNTKYTEANGVYHVIVDTSSQALITKGDVVTFWYKAYELSEIKIGTNKSIVAGLFDTNIKSAALDAELDTVARNFNPIEVKIGAGKLIKGLDLGIPNLRNGEKALLLFPSALGYGDNNLGPVNAWSSLVFEIEVIAVNK